MSPTPKTMDPTKAHIFVDRKFGHITFANVDLAIVLMEIWPNASECDKSVRQMSEWDAKNGTNIGPHMTFTVNYINIKSMVPWNWKQITRTGPKGTSKQTNKQKCRSIRSTSQRMYNKLEERRKETKQEKNWNYL